MHRLEYESLCRMHKQKRAMKGRKIDPRTGRVTVELATHASGRYGGQYSGWNMDNVSMYGRRKG